MGKGLEMTTVSEGSLHGRRVLVAEDEGPTRWSYVGLLRSAGARVTEARDGVEALELARSHPPDVIVADAAMPRLDGLGLCAALRRDPSLSEVTVVLLSDGSPPQAVWGAHEGSKPLVDAVVAAISSHAPAPPEALEDDTSTFEVDASMLEDVDEPAADAEERENVRAQSMVAMHRGPANRAPRAAHPVWRLRTARGRKERESGTGFGLQASSLSRFLGLGFVLLLAGTIAILLWHELGTAPVIEAPVTVVRPVRDSEPAREAKPPVPATAPAPASGIGAFSGTLRTGVDPRLKAAPGQGVLEVNGPAGVEVAIDGVDRGALPIRLALDEGRYVVRYRFEGRSIDRVYYVKPEATRMLRAITQPGGFVDAR